MGNLTTKHLLIALSVAAISLSVLPGAEAHPVLRYSNCVIGNFQCYCVDDVTWHGCTDSRTGGECLASYGVWLEESEGFACK